MSQNIKVGDLVMVVRSSCEHEERFLGSVFVVPKLIYDCSTCRTCGHYNDTQWHAASPDDLSTGYPITHLKRIPPLSELEGEKDFAELVDDMQRKLKEPA